MPDNIHIETANDGETFGAFRARMIEAAYENDRGILGYSVAGKNLGADTVTEAFDSEQGATCSFVIGDNAA